MKLQRQALSSHEVQTLCVNREVADKDSGRLYSKQVLCRIVNRCTLALPALLYQVLMEIMAFRSNRGYIGPMLASAICNQYNRRFSLLHLSTCNNKAWGGTRCTGRICGTVYNNIYRDCMLFYIAWYSYCSYSLAWYITGHSSLRGLYQHINYNGSLFLSKINRDMQISQTWPNWYTKHFKQSMEDHHFQRPNGAWGYIRYTLASCRCFC